VNLLALDTSSIACSVALEANGALIERYEEQPREHTRLLIPMIRSVLDESAAKLADLDAIVVGNGPGSFIGMRIAASVAQGLAFGSGLGIVPVSSLAAVAVAALAVSPSDYIAVAQDAHMSEVYLGLYVAGPDRLPNAVGEERIHGQGLIEELAKAGTRYLAAGAGWERYPELFENNRQFLTGMSSVRHPRALDLLGLGRREFRQNGALPPAGLEPAYLRRQVAAAPATSP
jgi:tRNA threonylcarbamoyladenosine biosynthesis protein TsaB